jgi:hypothetical protein
LKALERIFEAPDFGPSKNFWKSESPAAFPLKKPDRNPVTCGNADAPLRGAVESPHCLLGLSMCFVVRFAVRSAFECFSESLWLTVTLSDAYQQRAGLPAR